MRCPICLHDLPDDADRCPYCSAAIEHEDPEIAGEDITWSIIRTVSTEIEAALIAGRLRASGVPAFVLSQVDSSRGLTVGALAVAKVFVPEEMLPLAGEILDEPPIGEEPSGPDIHPSGAAGERDGGAKGPGD